MLATELAPVAMGEIKGPIFGAAEAVDGDVVGAIQSRVKKRKKRKKNEENGRGSSSNSMDPLEVFGTDIMLMILSHLDARSVALSLLVSRRWNGVASSDTIWGPKVCLFYALASIFLENLGIESVLESIIVNNFFNVLECVKTWRTLFFFLLIVNLSYFTTFIVLLSSFASLDVLIFTLS